MRTRAYVTLTTGEVFYPIRNVQQLIMECHRETCVVEVPKREEGRECGQHCSHINRQISKYFSTKGSESDERTMDTGAEGKRQGQEFPDKLAHLGVVERICSLVRNYVNDLGIDDKARRTARIMTVRVLVKTPARSKLR